MIEKTLKGKVNIYMGFETDIDSLPDSTEEFFELITYSIKEWINNKIEVVWLTIPEKKSFLIQTALSEGFTFHHTEKEKLVLVRKMHPEAFVVPYATHYIGTGGIVIDQNNRILVVRENYGNKAAVHYKLPGGTVEENEHIKDCVIREVFEETGIKTEFVSLICFRHKHDYRFGKSDIYFLCLLKPISIDIIVKSEEIAESLWMDLDTYLSHKNVHALNKEIVRAALTKKVLLNKDIEGYEVDKSIFEIYLPCQNSAD